MNANHSPDAAETDHGSVLPIVLVVVVVLGLITLALARYTSTTLVYGQVTEERADRLASAQGAMDNALERLEIKRSLCGTDSGVAGVTEPFPTVINGATAEVTCRNVGGTAGNVDGWAVVLTGYGNPDYDLVIESGGGTDKYIGGPIWMERPTSLDLKAPLTINGDLWYPDGCDPTDFTGLSLDSRLSYAPGNGTVCTTGVWSDRFKAPARSVPSTVSPTNNLAVAPDAYGCTVFQPGKYTTTPSLGANNYFRSGNYYFENVGTIVVKQQSALFGNISGVVGFPSIANAACDHARGLDSTSGATVYLGGSSRFDIEAQGGLEFSRRAQIGSTKTDLVSIEVIDPGLGSQPTWSDPIIETKSGNQKQLAIQGLVWAPRAGLSFSEVTNDTTAVLRGGAVLASLDAGASASATTFLIDVAPSNAARLLELTAVAHKDGETRLRAVVDWRVSTGETALKTWRVCTGSAC